MERAYRKRLRVVSGSGDVYLYDDEVEQGRKLEISRIIIWSNATTARVAGVFIDGHGYKHYIYVVSAGSGLTNTSAYLPLEIYEGERLGIVFSGTSAGEVFEVYITGKEVDLV